GRVVAAARSVSPRPGPISTSTGRSFPKTAGQSTGVRSSIRSRADEPFLRGNLVAGRPSALKRPPELPAVGVSLRTLRPKSRQPRDTSRYWPESLSASFTTVSPSAATPPTTTLPSGSRPIALCGRALEGVGEGVRDGHVVSAT